MCPKLKFDQMHLATTRNLTNTLIRMVNAPLKILESKYSSCPFRFCKQHLFSACTSCTKVKLNVLKDQITCVRIYKILRISSNNTRKAVWDSSKARLHNWLNLGFSMDDNRCQNAWKSTFQKRTRRWILKKRILNFPHSTSSFRNWWWSKSSFPKRLEKKTLHCFIKHYDLFPFFQYLFCLLTWFCAFYLFFFFQCCPIFVSVFQFCPFCLILFILSNFVHFVHVFHFCQYCLIWFHV